MLRRLGVASCAIGVLVLAFSIQRAWAQTVGTAPSARTLITQSIGTEVTQEEKHDVSRPLRDIEPPLTQPGPPRALPLRPWRSSGPSRVARSQADPVLSSPSEGPEALVQRSPPSAVDHSSPPESVAVEDVYQMCSF